MDHKSLQRLNRELNVSTPLRKLLRHPFRIPIAQWLKHRALRRKQPISKTAELFWGEKMTIVFPDYISMRLYKYGYYEDDLTKAYIAFLKPGMTCLDVGAHFGYTCLLAAHLVGETGKVFAFEPTPRTFEILRKNLSHLSNCHVENVAAFARTATLDFVDFGIANPGLNSLFSGKINDAGESTVPPTSIKVEAIRLDDYVSRNHLKIDFIKLDTEGAESQVLQGLECTLADQRPLLFIEVDDRYPMPGVPPSRETIAWITSIGYEPLEYSNGQLQGHLIRHNYNLTNLYFVPTKR